MSKICLITQGCSVNQSDTELMSGLLKSKGFTIVSSTEDADLIVFNSCVVKKPTEQAFFKRLKELKALGKPLVIAGCIPQVMPAKVKGYSLIGPHQVDNIVEVVEETLNGNEVSLLVTENRKRLNMPVLRKNDIVEIIPICKGCLGDPCSYCIVKRARGELYSYDIADIRSQVKKALSEGVKEIWLTAQDTGCYGKDKDTNIVELLRNVTEINKQFMVRVGMMNPNHVLEYLDDLIEVYQNKKVYKFLHIPVQSGNDDILKMMKRKYYVSDFRSIVETFRRKIPDITISTDIICGFPTETDEQFEDSIKLIKEIKPSVLNISRFWPRPRTEAAKMEQVHGNVTKERSSKLAHAFDWIGYENNKRWHNWVGPALVDEYGKDGTYVARNFAYKPIILESDDDLIGKVVKVMVTQTTKHDLRAKVIK